MRKRAQGVVKGTFPQPRQGCVLQASACGWERKFPDTDCHVRAWERGHCTSGRAQPPPHFQHGEARAPMRTDLRRGQQVQVAQGSHSCAVGSQPWGSTISCPVPACGSLITAFPTTASRTSRLSPATLGARDSASHLACPALKAVKFGSDLLKRAAKKLRQKLRRHHLCHLVALSRDRLCSASLAEGFEPLGLSPLNKTSLWCYLISLS